MKAMKLYTYLRNLFVAISQVLNALIGGDPQESISARCYRQTWMGPMRLINWVGLAFGQPHHCRGAYHALEAWAVEAGLRPHDVPASDNWRT